MSEVTYTPVSTEPHVVDETTDKENRPEAFLERLVSARYKNDLSPSAVTSYWRIRVLFFLRDPHAYHLQATIDGVQERGSSVRVTRPPIVAGTVTWFIDASTPANALPDADFLKNGGVVYVILVHRGEYTSAPPVEMVSAVKDDEMTSVHQYTVTLTSPVVSAIKHLPSSNSETSRDGHWSYPISFSQTMQMSKNNGAEPLEFTAAYEDRVELDTKQPGSAEGTSTARWAITYEVKDGSKSRDDVSISALSLFRVNALTEITFDCEAYFSDFGLILEDSVRRSITVDCRFLHE